jgi:tetratricopeptide (TPR) repeat protein
MLSKLTSVALVIALFVPAARAQDEISQATAKAQSEFSQAIALLNEGRVESYQIAKEKFQSVSKLFGQLVQKSKKGTMMSWYDFNTLYSQTNSLLWAGYTANLLGDTTSALELFEQARILSRESSITSLEASALTNIAAVYTRLGKKQLSLDFHHEAKELFQSAGDKDGEAAQLVNIATAHFNFGEKQVALDYYNP